MLEELRQQVIDEGLINVHLPGWVEAQLPLYLRAAGALLIPGRGGIIMSEAMAFGIPVIVYQADGTEDDLIIDQQTGMHLVDGSAAAFRDALIYLYSDEKRCAQMGKAGRQLIEQQFSTEHMLDQIVKAVVFASKSR